MSEEERIWANALSDAIEPANEYARKIKDRYLVTAKNDMYGIDQTMNIISQAYLAGVEHFRTIAFPSNGMANTSIGRTRGPTPCRSCAGTTTR